MNEKSRSPLIISILIPLAVGSLSSLLSRSMTTYSSISKPDFSPPSYVFPIVWTILYVLMGISSYIIYDSDSPAKGRALKIYMLQLFFNFCWSIIFFRFNLYLFALIWLIVLNALICLMIKEFYKISPLAAYLQIPYLLWCVFAALLNFLIYKMN